MQTSEKTYADFTLTARNPGGHSSLQRADSAIFDFVDAIATGTATRSCCEGNLAMFNILSGHRADERAAAERR